MTVCAVYAKRDVDTCTRGDFCICRGDDMKDILTRIDEWRAGVRDVQDNGVPLNGPALSALLADCSALLHDVRQVMHMVETNNRIASGDGKTDFNRARKAWGGKFVRSEVQRLLAVLTSQPAPVPPDERETKEPAP